MEFLVEQPLAINKREKVDFYTCAYLSGVIENNHQKSLEIITKYSGSDGDAFPRQEKLKLFESAWQIVENASILHQIIANSSVLFDRIGGYDELLVHFKTARYLRNKRQHVENIKNLSGRKSHLPLHGIVTWSHLVDHDHVEVREYFQYVTVEPLIHAMSFDFGGIFDDLKPSKNPDLLSIIAFDRPFYIFSFVSCLQAYYASVQKKLISDKQRVADAHKFSASLTEAGRVAVNAMIVRRQALA